MVIHHRALDISGERDNTTHTRIEQTCSYFHRMILFEYLFKLVLKLTSKRSSNTNTN